MQWSCVQRPREAHNDEWPDWWLPAVAARSQPCLFGFFCPNTLTLDCFPTFVALNCSSSMPDSTQSNVGWVMEDTRGTASLLLSCLSTILICTWSAVHPNVPPEGHSMWQSLRYRSTFVLLTLVAPEYVAACALRERSVARRLTKQMQKYSVVSTS